MRSHHTSIAQGLALGAAAFLTSAPAATQTARATDVVVEVRSYTLKPGTRDRFHQRFVREALPLLQRWKVDVVAYGPSLHDADSYFLIRAFPGLDERQRSEDAFYGSDEWRRGPREATLADIDGYTTIVVRMDEAALRVLRESLRQKPAGTAVTKITETVVLLPSPTSPA